MFGEKIKLEKLAEAKNVASDKITAELLTSINAELKEKGFEALEVVVAGTVADLEAKAANVETLTASNETLTSDLSAANEKVTDLEAKLAEANAKLDKTAGATAEEIQAEKDKIAKEGEEKDFVFENSPSAKALAKFQEQ